MTDLKATAVTSITLLAVDGKPPLARGNCFSVRAEDGKEYRVVNFVYENLEALLAEGSEWPIDVRTLDSRTAVIHDKRIPNEWYSTRFCEVCCPKALLPLPQQLLQERAQ